MDYEKIHDRIRDLISDKKTPKYRLGEILHGNTLRSRVTKNLRINNFMKNIKAGIIDIHKVNKIANFFGVSPEFILFGTK